jgi:hypothetical protein
MKFVRKNGKIKKRNAFIKILINRDILKNFSYFQGKIEDKIKI